MPFVRAFPMTLAVVGLASAQPGAPSRATNFRSVYTQGLVYLADTTLLKELGTDEATAKKLAD